MLYISELCEDCRRNEIDYAWTCIHDNGHVIPACDVWLSQRIALSKYTYKVYFLLKNNSNLNIYFVNRWIINKHGHLQNSAL